MITELRRWIARAIAVAVMITTLGMVRVQLDAVADTHRASERDEIISLE